MLNLNNLKSPKGAHRNIKRLGRGQASGQGTQAGKGHKGQKARKSSDISPGFEGGQMPLYRRQPKRGFKNADFKVQYTVVNLDVIENHFDSGEVTKAALIEKGLIKGINKSKPVKILAKGALTKKLKFVKIDKFSKTAKEAIEKSGSSITE